MTATPPTVESAPPDRTGLGAGVLCYTVWGFLPLLFHAAERSGAGALELVAWRTLWSVPLVIALVWIVDRGAALSALLRRPRDLGWLMLSAALIGVNWSIYVWATEKGLILAASLGYYITPLINMAAGALLFRERIDRTGQVAIGFAAVGVVIQGLALGQFPWVSLLLALSFGGYGIVRKRVNADAQTGLLVECVVLGVVAALYIGALTTHGQGVFGRSVAATLLLTACGPATVIPLALFSFAARRLPLTLMGFLQFIAPTLQFLCGLGLGERLTPAAALSFVFIWIGVVVFAWGVWRRGRKARYPKQA